MKAAVRVYTVPKRIRKKPQFENEIIPNFDTYLVYDTETTVDAYQNLKFGSFIIKSGKSIIEAGIFYNPEFINETEYAEIEKFLQKHQSFKLYTVGQFVEEIFYKEVYLKHIPCIGFNQPFDIPRLAISFGYARKHMQGGFVLKLSDNKAIPGIIIKHNSGNAFIKFQPTKYSRFPGFFIDLSTIAAALLPDIKHISLKKACELFHTEHQKLEAEEHGVVTEKYVEYNVGDILCTADLLDAVKEEISKYGLEIPLNKIYSSASIGKALLDSMGIKPISNVDEKLKKLFGIAMSSYFGGRVECKMRKTPVKVTYLDFTSMYPTIFTLMGLQQFLTTKEIEYHDDTENVRNLLRDVKLADLKEPKFYKNLWVFCKVKPNGDVLPIRTTYDDKNQNIGMPYATSTEELYYALPDLVVSKLITGKTPEIIAAWRVEAVDKQESLKTSKILGLEINPLKDEIFKKLIEERQRIKKTDDIRQKAIKIVANAASYGIFVELNPEDDDEELSVYSGSEFDEFNVFEKPGKYFNPIISALLTSGARLLLGVCEPILNEINKNYYYCDTDGIFVDPEAVNTLQSFFDSINPYENVEHLLKVESDNVWFYGISSKRYVLYHINENKITIDGKSNDKSYSLHGLGYILNPFGKSEEWQKQIWEDILKLVYNQISADEFYRKYDSFFVLSKMAVSNKELMKRLAKKLNRHKPYNGQIKPFNFFFVGVGANQDIKPIMPYSDDPQAAVYSDFMDYSTGKVMNGVEYFQKLSDVLYSYCNHKEAKLDGDTGLLNRRHVEIDGIRYIGKETNKLEENSVTLSQPYTNAYGYKELEEKLLSVSPKDTKTIGVNKMTLWKIKKRIKQHKPLHLSRKIRDKLLKLN
jgi:hypothetical protein